jgi:hypothetical protein
MCCRNPSFGLATKAKGLQGCGPRGSPGVTSETPGSVGECEGVSLHTPKAIPTLGEGVPVDSRNFRDRFEGSKFNFLWRFLYHWKALGTLMPEMGSHCSFEHLKHKLWPKERAGSRIASLTPNQKKSRIDPIYLATDDVPHTIGKLSMRATTLLQIALRSEVYSRSYGVPKSRESRLAGFRDSHAGVPREKSHLDVGPVERCRVYYKGEGGGFPQVRAMVSLVCPCCP